MSEAVEWTVLSRGERQTVQIGRELGVILEPGSIVALLGEMGSGKTRLVQGIAEGLKVPSSERVCSPSFALIHEHEGRIPLYHMDFFRLTSGSWETDLGLDDYLIGEGVCVIEWAERIEKWLPSDRLEVLLTICGARKRSIAFQAKGDRHVKYLMGLKEMVCGDWKWH